MFEKINWIKKILQKLKLFIFVINCRVYNLMVFSFYFICVEKFLQHSRSLFTKFSKPHAPGLGSVSIFASDIDLNICEYLKHRLILKLQHGFNGKPGFWRIWSAIYCFKRSRVSDSPLRQWCHQGISQNFDIKMGIKWESVQTANSIEFECEVISKEIFNLVPSFQKSEPNHCP